MTTSSIGARLDRLPVASFHRRLFALVGVGMFFDGFDIYLAGSVLGATLNSGFSTLAQNGLFVSVTFIGMMTGALISGFVGDRFGRRVSYQINLAVFGVAAFLSAVAPSMEVLIGLRFLMGLGLGAEAVVGYSLISEFVPPAQRGRWSGLIATIVTSGLPVSALLAFLLVPSFGWRIMFVLGGLGALFAWWLRRGLPESPRWLEAVGRRDEAEALLGAIEAEVSGGKPLPPPAASVPHTSPSWSLTKLAQAPLLSRMIVGCVSLVTVNMLIYGFITFLPSFLVKQGHSVFASFGYVLVMSLGGPLGSAIGAFSADRFGRKRTIILAAAAAACFGTSFAFTTDTLMLSLVGFLLTVPIYVLVALMFGIYVPELFPTEIRLRAVGICNTVGRSASIVVPLIVVPVFAAHGLAGVLAVMVLALLAMMLVVAGLGIEPERKSLEELAAPDAPRTIVEGPVVSG
ncbi:MFS transporter, putative metabolite:H+ symporter [Rhizobiales bacterium GAS191]|nr:MFS transporter, putative metabolite:H+ symporter [Rhizobiales bacterium GAS113]SEE96210.1 MFS transporter, putative metabolite:H+ symporter [Rhizobiales bacterium GAS191]